MHRSLRNYFPAQPGTPFFAQFPVPNFQKRAGCRSDAIFAKNFLRQLRFLSASLSPSSSFSPVDGRWNDLPRRQTMSESFSYSRRIRPGRQIFLTCFSRFSARLSPRIPLRGSMRQPSLIKTSFIRALRMKQIRKERRKERMNGNI